MKCKIGIRPTIDGRWGGIREGLEEQTMGMALAAKKLIEENVFLYRRHTRRGCNCSFYDRRRCRGGTLSRAVFKKTMFAQRFRLRLAGVTAAKQWILTR